MRLINVWDYSLFEFWDDDIPECAILSHTWAEEEVSFQEMQRVNVDDMVRSKKGFDKIRLTCEQAQGDRIDWAWVDTCCIDKTSSAELSEAINSMYAWYTQSKVCYVYLIDVPVPDLALDSWVHAFRRSRWFTRGWTLQELIAPSSLVFYGARWVQIGKMYHIDYSIPQASESFPGASSITTLVAAITGVPADVLCGQTPLHACSVAQRLFWASARHCSRQEDTAYCLLGIFDVNMPLLYGEGKKAFIRLQEEIMRVIDDHSILAWTSPGWDRETVLAPSPACFANSSSIVPTGEERGALSVMTKHGLNMSMFSRAIMLQSGSIAAGQSFAIAALNCRERQSGLQLTRVAILLVRDANAEGDRYFRITTPHHVHVIDLEIFDTASLFRSIFIRQRQVPNRIMSGSLRPHTSLVFQNVPLEPWNMRSMSSAPELPSLELGSVLDLVPCFGDLAVVTSEWLEQVGVTWTTPDCWTVSQLTLSPESFLMDVDGARTVFNVGTISVFAITLRPAFGIRGIQPFYVSFGIRRKPGADGDSFDDQIAMYLFRPKDTSEPNLFDQIKELLAGISHTEATHIQPEGTPSYDVSVLPSLRAGGFMASVDAPPGSHRVMVNTLSIDSTRELVFALTARHGKHMVGRQFTIVGGVRGFRGSKPLRELAEESGARAWASPVRGPGHGYPGFN